MAYNKFVWQKSDLKTVSKPKPESKPKPKAKS